MEKIHGLELFLHFEIPKTQLIYVWNQGKNALTFYLVLFFLSIFLPSVQSIGCLFFKYCLLHVRSHLHKNIPSYFKSIFLYTLYLTRTECFWTIQKFTKTFVHIGKSKFAPKIDVLYLTTNRVKWMFSIYQQTGLYQEIKLKWFKEKSSFLFLCFSGRLQTATKFNLTNKKEAYFRVVILFIRKSSKALPEALNREITVVQKKNWTPLFSISW